MVCPHRLHRRPLVHLFRIVVACRGGSGLPTPRRRTFADAVVAILFGTADAGWVDPHLAWLGAPRSTGFQPVSVHRGGSGLPTPHRRTFAEAVVASAHSDVAYASPSWLRLAAYAGSRGMANPSLSSCRPRRCRLSTCTGSVVRLCCTARCILRPLRIAPLRHRVSSEGLTRCILASKGFLIHENPRRDPGRAEEASRDRGGGGARAQTRAGARQGARQRDLWVADRRDQWREGARPVSAAPPRP